MNRARVQFFREEGVRADHNIVGEIDGGTIETMDEVNESGRAFVRPSLSGTAPVTVAEFREFVMQTNYLTDCERHDGAWVMGKKLWVQKFDASWDNPYRQQKETDPVVMVSWFDAINFANWSSASEGLPPAYRTRCHGQRSVELAEGDIGYRLPTVAEWEKSNLQLASTLDDAYPYSLAGSLHKGVCHQSKPDPKHGVGIQRLEWCWEFALSLTESMQQDRMNCVLGVPQLCQAKQGDNSEIYKLLRASKGEMAASVTGFRLIRGHLERLQ